MKARRMIEKNLEMGVNMKKRLIKYVNMKTAQKKLELDKKYIKKVEHLRNKYQVDKVKEMDRVPMEMQEMRELAIFSDEEFEKLEKVEMKPVKYGDVELDSEE